MERVRYSFDSVQFTTSCVYLKGVTKIVFFYHYTNIESKLTYEARLLQIETLIKVLSLGVIVLCKFSLNETNSTRRE